MALFPKLFAEKKPQGRPRAIEGEIMTLDDSLLASMTLEKSGGAYFLPVDQIIARKGYAAYEEMTTDEQVSLCLSFKKILVSGRTWEMKPADDSAKAKEIAKFVENNLRDINFSQIMKEALTALEYGFSMGEIVWERKQIEGKTQIAIGAIKHRNPRSLEIKMDQQGNLLMFKQHSRGKDVEIKPEKAWHFAHNPQFGNPYGRSDLRAAYRSWWAKKFIINFWNVYMERMGSPLTKATYPQGSPQDVKDALKKILTNLSAKQEVLVPEGVEIELIEAQRGGAPGFEKALAFHDSGIARAILMVALFGAGGDDITRGSDSQSHLHLRILFKMADEISQLLQHSFMCQVVKQLVDFNFEHENLYPKFVWQDYGQFEGMKVADTIRLLHAAGIVDMDQADVNYARSVLGLPLRLEGDKEDEVVRPQPLPPPADPNKPPPSAGQGNEIAKKGGGGSATAAEQLTIAEIFAGLQEITDGDEEAE